MQPKKSINDKELEILKFWQDNKIFEKSLNPHSPPHEGGARGGGEFESRTRPTDFTFYDGPPFATGLPHTGHILAGTIKDAIPRYQTMRGHRVRRVWGWDCHGLPIENMIEKELGLNSKKDIEDYGIDKFNQAAANSVLRYEKEWKQIIPRLGRWVDMEHPYKTMDATYTESVWWSWKTLYDKGLAYEGHKIMHICPRCETPLAQSEVGLEYHDVTDMTVTVEFKLKNKSYNGKPLYILAWTTTPWTLPGNTALAVNKELNYVVVESKFENEINYFIVAKKLLEKVFAKSASYKVIEEIKIEDYIGQDYEPLFQTFNNEKFLNKLENAENIWKVWHADFITEDAGTGIAHEAPAFGAEDMELAKANNIPVIKHVLMNGHFVSEVEESVPELAGLVVKKKDDSISTDIEIVKLLAHSGKLFSKEKIVHSYPLCWRCKTPLLNYATSSWFVDVPAIKDKLIAENNKVKWIPEHIRDGRFGKWLEGAREWAVSRRRYWGAPLPIWQSSSGKVKVIGSLAELAELNANKSKNKYIVMRHGECISNTKNILDMSGDELNHLTEKGKDIARENHNKLKGKIDIIFSSPFLRTQETAKIVADGNVEIIIDERLKETNFGGWDGKSVDDFIPWFNSLSGNYMDKRADVGESHRDIRHRVAEFLLDIENKYNHKNILIVTHGGPANMLLSWVQNFSDQQIEEGLFDEKSENFLQPGSYREIDWKKVCYDEKCEVNLHRPYIDEVKLEIDGEEYTRIPDVFDCWYESGSMPYAQLHYPFENKDIFEKNFPADFIAEGMDQTRGWFYSLINLAVGLGYKKEGTVDTQEKVLEKEKSIKEIISEKDIKEKIVYNNKSIFESDREKYTEMFGISPYKHVIVNGVVMADDGRKMSKSEKNYTDPMILVEKYGADALRLALANSPVMQGENVLFSNAVVDEAYKKNILKLENILNMYLLNPYDDEKYTTNENKGKPVNYFSKLEVINSDNNLDKYIIARLKQTINQVTIAYDNYKLDEATRPLETFIDILSVEYVKGSRDRLKGLSGEKEEIQSVATLQYVLLEISKLLAPMAPFLAERVYKEVGGIQESVHLDAWPEMSDLLQGELMVISKMKRTFESISLILNERNKVKIPVRQPLTLVRLPSMKEFDLDLNLIKEMTNIKSIETSDESSVWLDTNITVELKREGDQRELSRAIKDMRRDMGLVASDNIYLTIDSVRAGLVDEDYKNIMKIVEVKIETGQNILLVEKN